MNLAQKELQDFGMPEANREAGPMNRGILRESGYNLEELQQHIAKNKPLLTQDQREVGDDFI